VVEKAVLFRRDEHEVVDEDAVSGTARVVELHPWWDRADGIFPSPSVSEVLTSSSIAIPISCSRPAMATE